MVTEVVKHEVLHAALGHVYESRAGIDKKMMNIAMDCTINQYLGQLPEGCVTLHGLSKAVGEILPPFETSDFYYNKIINCKQYQDSKEMEGAGETLDEHDINAPGKDSAEMAKAVLQAASRKAATSAAGNVPRGIMEALESSSDAQIPWKRVLRNFVFSQVSNARKATTKKLHRRFALPVPGTRKERKMTLAMCLDESGSMQDDQIVLVLAEIQSICKQISKAYLIHADVEVSHVTEIKPGKKLEYKRRSSGGTAYQPAIDKALSLGADVIIYFGDFDCSDTPKDPGKPFLWVGVGDQKPPGTFGQVLRLK
jgi:predicted metal-dependent peptidase